MKALPVIFPTSETDPRVPVLRARLDAFYASCRTYDAFQEPSCAPQEWDHVLRGLDDSLTRAPRCRVLEFGAGRTGFARHLGERRAAIHFTAQDVTSANAEYLRQEADAVHLGPVCEIAGSFDVIFSTFVWEHITDPRATLAHLLRLLAPGGSLFLFCPRYDFPAYLSHSADHYSPLERLGLAGRLGLARLWALICRRPAFLIHPDPAILHLEWRMDRDAIHWASLHDLRLALRGRGSVTKLPIGAGGWRDWAVKNLFRINVQIKLSPPS